MLFAYNLQYTFPLFFYYFIFLCLPIHHASISPPAYHTTATSTAILIRVPYTYISHSTMFLLRSIQYEIFVLPPSCSSSTFALYFSTISFVPFAVYSMEKSGSTTFFLVPFPILYFIYFDGNNSRFQFHITVLFRLCWMFCYV